MLECLKIKKDDVVRHFCMSKIMAKNNTALCNSKLFIDKLFIYKYTYV